MQLKFLYNISNSIGSYIDILSRKLLKHADARGDFSGQIAYGGAHVVFTLQIEPEARIHFEK